MDLARLWGRSCFILFVDLVKAFDRLVRETVVGWPDHLPPDNWREHLREAGVDEERVDGIIDFIDQEGPALQQAGVEPHVQGMIKSLHTEAWFQIGGEEATERVLTKRGGRQGCKHGPPMFNLGYAVALKRIRTQVEEAGLCLELRVRGRDLMDE